MYSYFELFKIMHSHLYYFIFDLAEIQLSRIYNMCVSELITANQRLKKHLEYNTVVSFLHFLMQIAPYSVLLPGRKFLNANIMSKLPYRF